MALSDSQVERLNNMLGEYFTFLRISAFYSELATNSDVINAIHDTLGEDAAEVTLQRMKAGLPLEEHDGAVHDTIVDLASNEATYQNIIQMGDATINIMRFGPVYWVFALEYDDVGNFPSEEDAVAYAEFNWA